MRSQNLAFSDRWMFNRVMCEEDVCRRVLRAILGFDVGRIEYLNAEQAIEPAAASRGVRMDVFAREGDKVYDIEMQVEREPSLGRRMRYYQAVIDAGELEPGCGFNMLPESFVVFVCCYDPYGAGESVYRIERTCLERPQAEIGDDSHWLALNARAWEAETRSDLRDMLHYVQTGEVDGALSRDIDSLVLTYNQDREWVNRVLTYEQDTEIRCQRAKAEGIEQGIEQGEARLLALAQRLSAAGRLDDLLRAADDSAYRDALLEEFGL